MAPSRGPADRARHRLAGAWSTRAWRDVRHAPDGETRARGRQVRDRSAGAGRVRAAQPPAAVAAQRSAASTRDRPRDRAPAEGRTAGAGADEGRAQTPRWRAWAACGPRSRRTAPSRPANASAAETTGGGAGLMSAGQARDRGLQPLARFVAGAAAGVHPTTWASAGAGHAEGAGAGRLKVDDVGLVELNEAFAAQCGLRAPARPGRGAGQRQRRRDRARPPAGLQRRPPVGTWSRDAPAPGEFGLATMCIGVGQGIASIWQLV